MARILRPSKSYNRHFVVWGDHSSILSSGYMLYTTKVLYSKDEFFTDKEMFESTCRQMDIQSIVEQPQIYIVAQCDDTIAEKLSYVPARRDDIIEMSHPLIVDGVLLNDTMRFFQDIIYKICKNFERYN